jgi:hypothetical protein
MRPRSLVLLLAVAAALGLGACGNKQERVMHGTTEGAYLDIGPLKYQVQISRLLNPTDPQDAGFLIDVPPTTRLGPGDQWFAIFMLVQNGTNEPQRAAENYKITDTQGTVFRPIPLGRSNVFAYRPIDIPAKDSLPLPDSAAGDNSIQGALLLFKIPTKNFENRPLELSISTPAFPDQVGTVDLDV